jgi:8-oxo-dGTP pyrophosphatase MutT (NUDIX family)
MKLSQPYRAASFEEHEAYAGALADAEPDTFANIVYSLLPKGSDANTAKDTPLHSTWHTDQDWHKRAYGGVIVRPDGKFLLREPTNHFDGYAWTWPKGKMDSENEHPADTAIREVREETGFKTRIFDAVPGTFPSRTGSSTNLYLMRTDGEPERTDWETRKLQWASHDEAKKLIEQSPNKLGRLRDLAILESANKLLEKYKAK